MLVRKGNLELSAVIHKCLKLTVQLHEHSTEEYIVQSTSCISGEEHMGMSYNFLDKESFWIHFHHLLYKLHLIYGLMSRRPYIDGEK